MPDPYKRVQAGEKVTPVPAATWNSFIEAGAKARRSELDQKSEATPQYRQADIVRVRNDSGRDLDRASVLGLGGPIFTPGQSLDQFLREVTFRGVVPSGDHKGKFAVLLDPALRGGIARAYVGGVCPVRLDVADEAHACADAAAGDTFALVTMKDGSAQLLWKDDPGAYGSTTDPFYAGGTARWGIVRFGSTCGGGSSGSGQKGRCDCPDEPYLVEVDCGHCGHYYGGSKMPRFWWVEVRGSQTPPYGYGYGHCDGVRCEELKGTKIRMRHESASDMFYGYPVSTSDPTTGGYSNDPGVVETCAWSGAGTHCLKGELALDGKFWKVTITDKNECVIAVLRKPQIDFKCCGPNDGGWVLDGSSACLVDISLYPDPCTCCPVEQDCPPPDRPLCEETHCCIEDCACSLSVTVLNLATRTGTACTAVDADCYTSQGVPCHFGDPDCFNVPPPPVEKRCGGLNGVYPMRWVRGCTWEYAGNAYSGSVHTPQKARLTLSGTTWEFQLLGEDGQVANFRLLDWQCEENVIMTFVGGTCEIIGPVPTATFQLCLNAYGGYY